LRELVQNINMYLKKNTDYFLTAEEKRKLLEQQLNKFIDSVAYTEDKSFIKVKNIMHNEDTMQIKKFKYLNTIIDMMFQAEVNQYDATTKKYLVADKLLKIYSEYLNYMNRYQFQEKLKYLKKLQLNKREKALKKYIK